MQCHIKESFKKTYYWWITETAINDIFYSGSKAYNKASGDVANILITHIQSTRTSFVGNIWSFLSEIYKNVLLQGI